MNLEQIRMKIEATQLPLDTESAKHLALLNDEVIAAIKEWAIGQAPKKVSPKHKTKFDEVIAANNFNWGVEQYKNSIRRI